MTIPTKDERLQAEETLAYIRQTMESASTFTAVSGWGVVGVGTVGLIASWVSWAAGSSSILVVWIPTALVAGLISGAANVTKAKRLGVPLWSGSFRKMAWGLAPALVAGALMTQALTAAGATDLLPGMWLVLYGAGVTASGTFSVRALRWMGLTMLALGSLALLSPDLGLAVLGVGFGAAHVGFGFYVAQRHGG